MDPEDADYKCTLTEYSLQKAIKELNEDPKQRLGAVQSLRKWIRDQPHYTCRTDTKFLLAILRRSKFSQLVARELIENIMVARTTCPEYMANLDIQDNALAFLEKGLAVYPPKLDKEGRRIIIFRPGVNDLKDPKFNAINEVRGSLAMCEMLRDADENGSVNGILLVFDCTGTSMKHMTHGTMEQNKKTSKIYQDCNPERVKAYIFYNVGPILELLMGLFKSFMKKKNQERIQVHDTMESMYKVIPMELWPTEYLPDDYKGPSAGSIASIAADLKNRIMDPAVRARILDYTNERYKIDESKRPTGSAPNESFRRLNID